MDKYMLEYIPIRSLDGRSENYLKVAFGYELGYMPGGSFHRERGYYVSVKPVHKREEIEINSVLEGKTVLLKPVKRQTKKGEEEAKNILNSVKDELVEKVCMENNFELAETKEKTENKNIEDDLEK